MVIWECDICGIYYHGGVAMTFFNNVFENFGHNGWADEIHFWVLDRLKLSNLALLSMISKAQNYLKT